LVVPHTPQLVEIKLGITGAAVDMVPAYEKNIEHAMQKHTRF
jgi:hypothetical protein